MFKALLLEESDGKVSASLQDLEESRLPEGDVTVAVEYTTLNYKDGMIVKGLGRLVRSYPHVPGIDFAGTVAESHNPGFKPGDRVVLTGWRVGEAHWGGHAQKARVKGDWLVPLPDALSTKRAMAIGTAGFTAMLAVMALQAHGVTPDKGEVLVTGAAGGVGSVATAVLSNLGYQVAASTGRAETHDYLHTLGPGTGRRWTGPRQRGRRGTDAAAQGNASCAAGRGRDRPERCHHLGQSSAQSALSLRFGPQVQTLPRQGMTLCLLC